MSETARARRLWPIIAVGVLVQIAVVAAVALAQSDPEGDTPVEQAIGSAPTLSEECGNAHAGHSVMMWSPTMADEMVEADCGWPYDPFVVSLAGGADAAELDAPFEPMMYAELWDAIGEEGMGLCLLGTDTSPSEEGQAFGFSYEVAAPGCPDAEPTGTMSVAEWGTEAQRDQAAKRGSEAGRVLVLGRWTVHLEGTAEQLVPSLERRGAQLVG